MQTIRVQTSQNIEVEYQLAGIGDRLVAYLVDLAIYFAYSFIAGIIISSVPGRVPGWIVFLVYLPVLFYSLVCEIFLNGQTGGKKVMAIQVISLDGGQASFGQYITRWLFSIVDIMMGWGVVAVVMISLSEKNQRLGDKVAGTAVVRTRQKTRLHDTIFVDTVDIYQPLYPGVVALTERDISLVQEVLNRNRKMPNYGLIIKTADKIKNVLGLQSNHEPEDFLRTILKDYNHITARM
jgi:uncharacterized RDD family membrane protein YckC